MGAVVGFIIFLVIWLIIKGASSSTPATPSGYDRLVAKGIPARGILLMVSSTGTKVGPVTRRFEQRQVVIDVEVPGKEPYEVSANPLIPLNLVRDVLPGATVELRVDPSNPNQMAIIGPGTGFVQSVLRTS